MKKRKSHSVTLIQPVIREWMESVCNPAYFEELILNHEKTLLVAERGGEVCGTAYGYPDGGRYYAGGLYVAVKGQRIGTLLMEARAVEAKRLGYKELVNVVYENNHDALNFLRHRGWVIEEVETYDGVRYCKHVLTLE